VRGQDGGWGVARVHGDDAVIVIVVVVVSGGSYWGRFARVWGGQ
jgi:hypothetical protein